MELMCLVFSEQLHLPAFFLFSFKVSGYSVQHKNVVKSLQFNNKYSHSNNGWLFISEYIHLLEWLGNLCFRCLLWLTSFLHNLQSGLYCIYSEKILENKRLYNLAYTLPLNRASTIESSVTITYDFLLEQPSVVSKTVLPTQFNPEA